jgi:inorganic pyrophosphatase
VAGGQLHAFVEIPKGSRNKYEYDAALGHVVLDRTLWTSVVYPADYGYLMGTLGRDGDPVDAMILVAEPTFPGCLIPVEPIGVFEMRDEAGEDDKDGKNTEVVGWRGRDHADEVVAAGLAAAAGQA